MVGPLRHRYMMGGLLEAWDWYDNALQLLIKEDGFAGYNKSQSMLLMYIASGVKRPVEIARKMRLSRQAIRHIANHMIEHKVIQAHDDPADLRSVVLDFVPKARPLQLSAQAAIAKLESRLRKQLGAAKYQFLMDVLNEDWGPAVTEADFFVPTQSRRRKTDAKPLKKKSGTK